MPARVLVDEHDKFRPRVSDGVAISLGARIKNPAPGHEEFLGNTFQGYCRDILRFNGQPIPGNPLELVARAQMTGDLPAIMANVATNFLIQGFEEAEETFEVWTDEGSLPDFKQATLALASEADDLDEIKERGTYDYGDLSDKAENVQLVTFGKMFAITRQAIINDDQRLLRQLPLNMGRAAKRKIGDCVYAVLTANAEMGDGVALFHADHGNVGTSAVIGVSSVAEAIKKMGIQTDPLGNALLNLRPKYFIAPKAVEGAGEVFFTSDKFSDHNTVAADSSFASTRNNPYAGNSFTRVYDGRLDAASEAAYYFAGPKGMTVTVFYLGGIKKPYIEQREGWTVDGTEFKVRIDAAAKAVDWVALLSNAGGS